MPLIQVTLIQGYSESARIGICERITRAVRATIAAPLEGTVVSINEVAPAAYMRGGKPFRTPGPELPDGAQLVRDFLAAMQARDLVRAEGFLSSDFMMEFPGAVRMHKLAELIEWARPRYKSVAKTYTRFDQAFNDDATVVYCYGTLSGAWLDGTAFADIRFIDRFTIRDGKIADQTVWNDLAEVKK